MKLHGERGPGPVRYKWTLAPAGYVRTVMSPCHDMIVPLIPFFLVARVKVNENAWPHGPEYHFDVLANVTATPLHAGRPKSDDAKFQVVCRPDSWDKLNCRVDDGVSWYKRLHSPIEEDASESASPSDEISSEPFAVKFDERGVEYLLVDQDINTSHLNLIKSIVELLSVGADLNGRPDGAFEAAENTTVGECLVTFKPSHRPLKNRHERVYELESLPRLNKVPGETILLEKITDLDNCSRYASFYYGTYGGKPFDKSLDSQLASTVTRISVSDVEYVATATKEGKHGSPVPYEKYSVVENVSLVLRSIQPAKSELPRVRNAGKTSILANSDIEVIRYMM